MSTPPRRHLIVRRCRVVLGFLAARGHVLLRAGGGCGGGCFATRRPLPLPPRRALRRALRALRLGMLGRALLGAAAHGATVTVDEGFAVAAEDVVGGVAGVGGTAGLTTGRVLPPAGVTFMHGDKTSPTSPTRRHQMDPAA